MENPFQYGVYVASMFYSFFDIFMVTYFGNEIKFGKFFGFFVLFHCDKERIDFHSFEKNIASSQLPNCLFECNWVDQSRASKSCILVVKEVLKHPQVLVIGIYPLDLEIFSNVRNHLKF